MSGPVQVNCIHKEIVVEFLMWDIAAPALLMQDLFIITEKKKKHDRHIFELHVFSEIVLTFAVGL